MEELLAGILGAIFEFLFEALLEVLLGIGADLLSRALRRLFVSSRRSGPALSTLVFAVAGIVAGFSSMLIFPHPLVHPSRFHGISLLISPAASGLVMALIGNMVRRSGRQSIRIETFRYGFVFALAMALVRFALLK